jgi:hypothetical protein
VGGNFASSFEEVFSVVVGEGASLRGEEAFVFR